MRNPLARGLIGLAAVAAVVVLFVVLAGGDDDKLGQRRDHHPDPGAGHGRDRDTGQGQARPSRRARHPANRGREGGKPAGGVQKLTYKNGDRIQFIVASDVADEIHVHGYDLTKDVPAGGTVRFSFPARIEGVFEVELEGRKEQIAELRVSPG